MRAPLAQLIRENTTAFVDHLERARDGHDGAMHRARVWSRRLREAILLAQAVTWDAGALPLIRDIRRCATAIGGVRELTVALRDVDSDEAAHRWGPVAAARVLDHLARERERRVTAMQAKLRRVHARKILARAEALAGKVERLDPNAWQTALRARVRKRALRLQDTLHAAGTLYAAGTLHDIRIAAKKLRYALELAQTTAGAPVARDLTRLKRLQELLGRLHDLQVLESFVRAVAVETAEDAAVSTALDHMLADLDRDCRALHARFLRQLDRLVASARRAERDIAVWLSPRRPLRIARLKSSRVRPASRAASA